MRVLLLTTDAYGGHGGIALYNRDIAEALAAMPEVDEVVIIPRTTPLPLTAMPDKVRFLSHAARSKRRYILAALRESTTPFDFVICGHMNLLPLATLLNVKLRAPIALMVYGIEAWAQPPRWVRQLLPQLNAIWTISAVTRDRMNGWAQLPVARFVLLPNAIHLDQYGMAGKRADLVARHRLEGRKVLMTLARLPGFDRYKGVDEILEGMPALLAGDPTLTYVVVGDGSDRPRLEAKARALGVEKRVIFTGFIEESDKADYFRLADVFVMPGRGEGFGFVFLEALACGVPSVGSQLDGSREALLDGALGELVDPRDPASVRAGILRALAKPLGIPPGLAYFAWPQFCERVAAAVRSLNPAVEQSK